MLLTIGKVGTLQYVSHYVYKFNTSFVVVFADFILFSEN
jgi:hypothetical protein